MKKVFFILAACFLLFGSCTLFFGSDSKSKPPSTSTTQVRLLTGTTVPSSSVGVNGDLYLDTAAAILYVKNAGVWLSVAELQGPAGEDGLDASVWHTGIVVPASSLGTDGDYYIDWSAAKLYHKVSGSWGTAISLQGSTGAGIGIGEVTLPNPVEPEIVNIQVCRSVGEEDVLVNLLPGTAYNLTDALMVTPLLYAERQDADSYTWIVNGEVAEVVDGDGQEFDFFSYLLAACRTFALKEFTIQLNSYSLLG